MAYHDLLVEISAKDDVEAELRKANAARAHSPFLLNAPLGIYLEELHKEAFRINEIAKIVRDRSLPHDLAAANQLAHDRIAFVNRIGELITKFEPFLRLSDFSQPSN